MCHKADVELEWTWDGVAAPNRTVPEPTNRGPIPELEPMRVEARFSGQQYRHRYQSRTIRMKVPFSAMARLPCPVRQLTSRTVTHYKSSIVKPAVLLLVFNCLCILTTRLVSMIHCT